LSEAFPGNDLLDRGERIDARFFRFDERLANLRLARNPSRKCPDGGTPEAIGKD
jgi:hypothetical protein